MHWLKRITVLVVALLGIAVFAVWFLLSSSLLAKTRGDLTAQLLSNKLGQEVQINGGVSVDLGSELHLTTEGLVLPSQPMTEVDLAAIGRLEFDLALRDLLKGRITLSALRVDGAKVVLLVRQDGSASWSLTNPEPIKSNGLSTSETAGVESKSPGAATASNGNLMDFLVGQEIRFTNSDLMYQDARNGLDLDLQLPSFEMSQKDHSAPFVLEGTGTLNGQELTLNGNFPPDQPFKVAAEFSQISLTVDGAPETGGYSSGFTAALSAKIVKLDQLLDVFKLQKSVSGAGQVSASFQTSAGSSSISDVDISVSLDGGQSLEVTGDLGKIGDPSDVTLDTKVRLYSTANMPPPTGKRRDLKLTGVDMQLIAQPDGKPQRRMVIETNGFAIDTAGEGPPPISFSQISRTPDGLLRIGKAELRIGPPEAPFLIFSGEIEDALRLEGIDFLAKLAIPAASLLGPELFQTSDVLGVISGDFRLSGNARELGLSELTAKSEGTELWHLDVGGSVRNALSFSDVDLDVSANVPSGAEFLTALDLKPVDIGPVAFSTKLSSQGEKWQSTTTIAVKESGLGLFADLNLDEEHPTVTGKIESDLIEMEHLRAIVAAAVELRKLDDKTKATTPQADPDETPPQSEQVIQPLVLNKPNEPDPDVSTTSPASGPFRNVTLKPLGHEILFSGMDLSVKIDLREVEGKKGSSSLKSDFEMKDDKARLGPLKFEYDGAHFDINGSMDLVEDPDNLKLWGSTGGWNFGKIMKELQFKKSASGTLYANFDLTGSHTSAREFLRSMKGSATVSMKNGTIDTKLLDLAGLGVLPWLFSKDRRDVASIVCARAPLHISNGRISTKQAVVETDQVQIVVLGDVNLKNNTLDVAGQPRRIGKPLSRSPWPFTAKGPISNPKIKVKDGPKRLRRSDGASTMPKRRKICVPDILQLK